MYCLASLKQHKRTFRTGSRQLHLFFVLMLSSMVLQAESSANAVVNNTAAAGEADASAVTKAQQPEAQQQGYKFPRWPQRQQQIRQRIPPPPPGPYMSTALSDHSIGGLTFGRDTNKAETNRPVDRNRFGPSNMSMDMFSPDRPWPDHLRSNTTNSPNRWLPETGYHYVKPPVKKRQRSSIHSNYRDNNPVAMPNRRFDPDMSWPGSRWTPAMGMSRPSGPTYSRPNSYAPNYGSRYNGAVNNSGMYPVSPAYRAPYSSGKP